MIIERKLHDPINQRHGNIKEMKVITFEDLEMWLADV